MLVPAHCGVQMNSLNTSKPLHKPESETKKNKDFLHKRGNTLGVYGGGRLLCPASKAFDHWLGRKWTLLPEQQWSMLPWCSEAKEEPGRGADGKHGETTGSDGGKCSCAKARDPAGHEFFDSTTSFETTNNFSRK